MTPNDRKVLSQLLEKVKAINALKEYQKFIYFVNKCIEESRKRNANSFLERFTDLRNAARLSYQAFEGRRIMGARLHSVSGVHLFGVLS